MGVCNTRLFLNKETRLVEALCDYVSCSTRCDPGTDEKREEIKSLMEELNGIAQGESSGLGDSMIQSVNAYERMSYVQEAMRD